MGLKNSAFILSYHLYSKKQTGQAVRTQKNKAADSLATVIADQQPKLNGPSLSLTVIEDWAGMTLDPLRSVDSFFAPRNPRQVLRGREWKI